MEYMKEYDHKKIEKKWQTLWEKKGIFQALDNSKKPKYYSLIEFPYPSGDGLHVGHPRPYIGMDIISRKRRLEGFNVLYPIGWDAFGLPTENYAIKTGQDPRVVTKKNTDTFRRQIKSLGVSFDWSREINTTDPKYYKWTQWIFLQFLKKGLAYKKKMEINWCPKDKTGLANEEVVNGCCERCGTVVEKREKEQWMLAITKYADRLDKDLDTVDYLPQIKLGQRNWIGRSEGAEIEFGIHPSPALPEGEGEMPRFFTTNPELWRALQDKALEMRKNPTNGEKIMWDLLRRNNPSLILPEGEGKNSKGFHFRRQHIIDRFIVDFVCVEKRLVVEVDGDIHDYKKAEDQERTKILNQLGFEVMRFSNDEVIKNKEGVLEKIIFKLNSVSSKALSFGEGLGGVDLDYSSPSGRLGGVKVFTTRPDTIFGATYLVLAPEHELVQKLKSQISNLEEVEKYIKKVKSKTEIERTAEDKAKTGVELKGIKAINPANTQALPVWIADYVLATYGTGAIMAVPADDSRDKEFAEKFKLPIVEDYNKAGFEDFGKKVTTFKLRDWVFSRQRYWGEPIPVVFCENCKLRGPASTDRQDLSVNAGWVPVPEKDLPVELPKVKNYQPTESGESPLANIAKWVNVKCPKCKGPAKRETDTMPNWAGSSWYYLRYTDPKNKKEFAGKKNLKYWLTHPLTPSRREGGKVLSFGEDLGGVDWYNGGNEHTTLHLLYSRFWHKFLFDLKLVPTSEPYLKRTSHGMILGEGGVKMSKSLGNVINPDDIVKTFGADTLRIYEMFMGPFNQSVAWSTESIIGARRFLERVWNLQYKVQKNKKYTEFEIEKTIKKVTEDIEEMKFNTAISTLMIFTNEINKLEFISQEAYEKFLKILSPFAPHITEELWQTLGHKKSINFESWPEADLQKIKNEEIKIVIQINGKVRAEMMIKADDNEENIKKQAVLNEVVSKHLSGQTVRKIFYVKGRLINIVV
jgi:leucyl-tRNA synthetase